MESSIKNIERLLPLYTQLMEVQNKETTIWEEINNGILACIPAFVGEKYEKSNLKLLYVGRAINGWERDYTATSAGEMAEKTLQQVFSIHEDIVNMNGFKGTGAKRAYYHKNYNYWRLLRFLLAQGGDAIGGDSDWYEDAQKTDWNQKFICSNLYKVAPKNGNNPNAATQKVQIDACVKILKAELDLYKPQLAVFVTGNNWFTSSWKGKDAFQNICDQYECITDSPYIEGYGKAGDTEVVVCKRPDSRGKTICYAEQMAEEIYKTFNSVK